MAHVGGMDNIVNTAEENENKDKALVQKAEAALTYCRDRESVARRELAATVEASKIAKEKMEKVFAKCEERAVARRKSGLIEMNAGY